MLAVLTVCGMLLVFAAIRAAPGDPALAALGEQASPAAVAALRHEWRLDLPPPLQFAGWLSDVLRGNLGRSLNVAQGLPVSGLLRSRLPNTLFVGAYALLIAVAFSLLAGTVAARTRGRLPDTAVTSLAIVGISMPDFWVAYMLIYSFALTLGWLPSYGFVSPGESLRGALSTGLLPALAIAAPMAAVFTRILRVSLIETASQDYVRAARALGETERGTFLHYVLRNALIPYVTVIGLQVRYLLGGTVVIERVFGIPGVGSLMVDAAFGRDYPVVQACALTYLFASLVASFAADAACTALNPRART